MIDPAALHDRACTLADDYADKEYAAGMLEDALATLEANIAAELKASGEPVTLIPKLIKGHSEWVTMSQEWREAKKQANMARFHYDQANRYQDNQRTKESTERALAR